MGVLNKTKCYLIGNMQYADGSGWRKDITPSLKAFGITVFDPYTKPFIDPVKEDENTHRILAEKMADGDYDSVRDHMKKVRQMDLSLVDKSDFIIYHLQPSVPTFGSMEELTVAVKARKPVFTVIEGGISKTPFWVTAMLPREQMFDTFWDILNHIGKIDAGEIKPDTKYWRLLDMSVR